MRFVLEVDVDGFASAEEKAKELGRILRYWAGNLSHYALLPGDGAVVSDSEYREVGGWSIRE
ncbi:hypothetical protein ABZ348_25915 [Streptomyces sp. NPDC005963]|uniref:hypothetical protein n=1 Tax=Streptomyces sp. NPDC005963 TaxID=3156721 RepID=UPI0033CB62FF